MHRATCSLACDADTPRLGREFLRNVLHRWEMPVQLVEDAELLLSEVVSNAVMHGQCERTEITAVLDTDEPDQDGPGGGPAGRGLTVWVVDAVPPADLPTGEPTADQIGGWGLHLIHSIADQWGIDPDGEGKRVWFRLHPDRYASPRTGPVR